MNRFVILFILSLQFYPSAYAQPSKQQTRNLIAFSKLVGYVRYFYPADELQNDSCWNAISMYGIQRMFIARNDKELIAELRALFCPLVPEIRIDFADKIDESLPLDARSNHKKDQLVYWQHQGFGINSDETSPYKSVRVNSRVEYEKKAHRLNYFSLTKILQLEQFKGRPFVFTLDIAAQRKKDNQNDNLFAGPYPPIPNQGLLNTERKAIVEVKESFVFRGTIDIDLPLIQFGCFIDPLIENVQIDNPQLFIQNNDNKLIPIDLSLVELIDFSRDPTVQRTEYAFMIGKIRQEPLFNGAIKAGEVIKKELVSGISVSVPLSLYSDGRHTYPTADSILLTTFQNSTNEMPSDTSKETIETRLASFIKAWNVLRHFYPYWGDAATSPDSIFEQTVQKVFSDISKHDFIETLQLLTVPLNDGQSRVDFYNGTKESVIASIPLFAAAIENRIFVKGVIDNDLSKRIHPGDEILSINGLSASEYLTKKEALISGSQQWKRSKGLAVLFNGPNHSSVKLKLRTAAGERKIQVPRSVLLPGPQNEFFLERRQAARWINEAFYYVDLTAKNVGANPHILQEMDLAKAIIFDLRGTPPATISSAQLLNQILEQLTTASNVNYHLYIPEIRYPDFQNVSYKILTQQIHPRQKKIKANVYFLTDARTIGSLETYLEIVKDYKLGTLVGQPTAGANGIVNTLLLPGGYRLYFSGILVKNNAGNKLHLAGVVPDIKVELTYKALKEGRDEILERAIKQAEQETSPTTADN